MIAASGCPRPGAAFHRRASKLRRPFPPAAALQGTYLGTLLFWGLIGLVNCEAIPTVSMLRRRMVGSTNRMTAGMLWSWGSHHGVRSDHLVYDQAVRGNDWHLDRCRGAGTPRPSDGKHQMHRLRPGAFNQDCVSETSDGPLRSGRVNALPPPSTPAARRTLSREALPAE
jgi:hypothetical protein